MSEAAKILLDRAAEIKEEAIATYDRTIRDALLERGLLLDSVAVLESTAKGICEHTDTVEHKETRRCGTHGRDEEHVTIVSCAVCGKYIETKY